jgi:hypothetical protein
MDTRALRRVCYTFCDLCRFVVAFFVEVERLTVVSCVQPSYRVSLSGPCRTPSDFVDKKFRTVSPRAKKNYGNKPEKPAPTPPPRSQSARPSSAKRNQNPSPRPSTPDAKLLKASAAPKSSKDIAYLRQASSRLRPTSARPGSAVPGRSAVGGGGAGAGAIAANGGEGRDSNSPAAMTRPGTATSRPGTASSVTLNDLGDAPGGFGLSGGGGLGAPSPGELSSNGSSPGRMADLVEVGGGGGGGGGGRERATLESEGLDWLHPDALETLKVGGVYKLLYKLNPVVTHSLKAAPGFNP